MAKLVRKTKHLEYTAENRPEEGDIWTVRIKSDQHVIFEETFYKEDWLVFCKEIQELLR